MIRAFIADDEKLAVERLEILLETYEGLSVIGTATRSQAAVEQIEALRPDVVFLDIEMPGLDGLDLARRLVERSETPPCIVFVTAYRDFAVGAFDTGAVDYLTKPVQRERLNETVERVRLVLEGRTARHRLFEMIDAVDAFRRDGSAPREDHDYLWVHQRGEMIRIDLLNATRIGAEREYARIFIAGRSFLHRESLGALAERLKPHGYVRVHRSHLINKKHILSLERPRVGAPILTLDDGSSVPVGRRFRSVLKSLIDH